MRLSPYASACHIVQNFNVSPPHVDTLRDFEGVSDTLSDFKGVQTFLQINTCAAPLVP